MQIALGERFFKNLKSSSMHIRNIKKMMPIPLVLAWLEGAEGLSLRAAGVLRTEYEDQAVSVMLTMAIRVIVMMVVLGIPWATIFCCNQVNFDSMFAPLRQQSR